MDTRRGSVLPRQRVALYIERRFSSESNQSKHRHQRNDSLIPRVTRRRNGACPASYLTIQPISPVVSTLSTVAVAMTCVHPSLSSNTEPICISTSARELASTPIVTFPVRPGLKNTTQAKTHPEKSLPLYAMGGPQPARSGFAVGRAASDSI